MKYSNDPLWFPLTTAFLGAVLLTGFVTIAPSCIAQEDVRKRQFDPNPYPPEPKKTGPQWDSNPNPAPQPVNWFSPQTPTNPNEPKRTGAQWDANPNPAPQPVNWFANPNPNPAAVNWFPQQGNQNPPQPQTQNPTAPPQGGALSGTGSPAVGVSQLEQEFSHRLFLFQMSGFQLQS